MHLLFLLALYFLPTIIAHARHSTSTVGISIVNLLFGWTGIGWIITLLWAIFSATWEDHGIYRHPAYNYQGDYRMRNGQYGPPQAPHYPVRYPQRWN